ncbi:MAG: fructosamine kinase family protein [Acidimicrobiales bacterium]
MPGGTALPVDLARRLGVDRSSATPVHGGDTATAFCVETLGGPCFVKTHRSPPPYFFATEATGLDWLAERGARVPEVIAVSDEAPAHLALRWIDIGPRPAGGDRTEAELGRMLAELHRPRTGDRFGRPDRRTTGSRGLPNERFDTWVESFAANRLLPLARLACDEGSLPDTTIRGLETIAERLADLGGDPEPPSLLHGDLWAGNRLVDSSGENWLIDPAAQFGHREFDLAMMRLFGGFGPAAFAAYNEAFPLASGWDDRIELHQLAPLAVHAIKFGGGYVAATAHAVDHYR